MAENYEMTMKAGDTGEPVRACVRNRSDKKAPDWSGATVQFKLLDPGSSDPTAPLIDAAGSVELPTATSGTIRYDWSPGDTDDLLGRYMAFFVVTDGTLIESYPREGYIWINVEQG